MRERLEGRESGRIVGARKGNSRQGIKREERQDRIKKRTILPYDTRRDNSAYFRLKQC